MTTNLFTITEISEKTGVHPQTLRNWERQKLIEPIRVAGNQRIYNDKHIEQIHEILKLKDEGLRLKGVLNVITGKKTSFGKNSKQRMAVVAQTLEKTNPEPTEKSKPAKTEETGRTSEAKVKDVPTTSTSITESQSTAIAARRGRPKFKIADLENMSNAELNDLAKEEGVLYFRQMIKDELLTALAYPSQREAMKEQAKARTKERYGSKVYGVKAKERAAQKAEKAQETGDESANVEVKAKTTEPATSETSAKTKGKGKSISTPNVATAAQPQKKVKSNTIADVKEAKKRGLVQANDKQSAKEDLDTRQKLIAEILAMGQEGKSPEEIAKDLAKQYK